ncbi:MAG: YraN family protein [Litorimonas sp.]
MTDPRSQKARQRAEKAGRRAETWVAAYLIVTGHRILARRFKTGSGEIDLIAQRGKTIVFIEVKQRAKAEHTIDPVTARSEERIIRAGEIFLSRHPGFVDQGHALRYDIVIVTGRWRITHRRDVFRGW